MIDLEKFISNDIKTQELISSILKHNNENIMMKIKELNNYLFKELCLKEYLDECEPEYCSFRLSNTCPYVVIIKLMYSKYKINLIKETVSN
ncbi:hypothetical protein [Acetivibrio cellulolyticus]|uniref:hypothetical protein n=1 Tax=Acetivibrio cellulolyticus TaxID=35830 RepID=UPI0001E2F55C|nr:hypothetical protein [Acetivibrio cellulolyticus]